MFRIMRSSRWQNRPMSVRIITLALVAAFISTLFELIANTPALITGGLTPSDLSLEDFSWDDALNAEADEEGIVMALQPNKCASFEYTGLDTKLGSVAVQLSGQGAVQVALAITDSARMYEYQQIYTIVCVAQDKVLSQFNVPVASADEATSLRVQLTSTEGGSFTLESVRVNEPIAFVFQPLRACIVFAAVFALLCALSLRGFDAAYDFRKPSHKLIILLPILAMMALCYGISVWIHPDVPLLSGMTDEEALQTKGDAYATLFETLQSGRLAVEDGPGRNILELSNPYDVSERTLHGVGNRFDFALYNQEYYIYFGVAPVLTVYFPFHALTGRVPTSRDASLLLGMIAIALLGWAVCGFAKRYARGANVLALSLCSITAVFASGTMLLIASADHYYLAMLSFVCFASGALAFGIHAAQRKRGKIAVFQYTMSGICFALTVMSRANGALLLATALAPLFLCELIRKRARLREAIAFLLPAVIGIVAQLWYNAARFGSVFDFGAAHQITVTDVHYRGMALTDVPRALYHYLLEPLTFTDVFPYLRLDSHTVSALEHYAYIMPSAGMLAFPVVWALVAMPLSTPRGMGESALLRTERRWVFLLPLIASVPLMVLSYGLAGAMMRYTCDFRLFFALPAVCCALPLMTHADTPERKLLSATMVGLCITTVAIGLGLIFSNERNNIQTYSPQLFYSLQRMFFPY